MKTARFYMWLTAFFLTLGLVASYPAHALQATTGASTAQSDKKDDSTSTKKKKKKKRVMTRRQRHHRTLQRKPRPALKLAQQKPKNRARRKVKTPGPARHHSASRRRALKFSRGRYQRSKA